MDVHPTKNVSIGIDPYPYKLQYILYTHNYRGYVPIYGNDSHSYAHQEPQLQPH